MSPRFLNFFGTYGLLRDNLLVGRGSSRAGRLLHSDSVGVPLVLRRGLRLSRGRLEEVEVEHCDW